MPTPPGVSDDTLDAGVVRHRDGYTVVTNSTLKRLLGYQKAHAGFAALLTLYVVMASKPDGWRFSADRLAREVGANRQVVLRLLHGLEDLGYVARRRLSTGKGSLRTQTVFDRDGHPPEARLSEYGIRTPSVTSTNTPSPQVVSESVLRTPSVTSPDTEFPQVVSESGIRTPQSVLRSHYSVSQSVPGPRAERGGDEPDDDGRTDDIDLTDDKTDDDPRDPYTRHREFLDDYRQELVAVLGADTPQKLRVLTDPAPLRAWAARHPDPRDAADELTDDMNPGRVRNVAALIWTRLQRGPRPDAVPDTPEAAHGTSTRPEYQTLTDALTHPGQCRCQLPAANRRHQPGFVGGHQFVAEDQDGHHLVEVA